MAHLLFKRKLFGKTMRLLIERGYNTKKSFLKKSNLQTENTLLEEHLDFEISAVKAIIFSKKFFCIVASLD